MSKELKPNVRRLSTRTQTNIKYHGLYPDTRDTPDRTDERLSVSLTDVVTWSRMGKCDICLVINEHSRSTSTDRLEYRP